MSQASFRLLDPVARPRSRLRGAWLPWLALVTISIVVGLRLFDLDRLPGEIYGDIAIVYDYIEDILAGRWPRHFVASFGPLYPYLVIPGVWLTGLTYVGLKLASVMISLLVLLMIYAFGRELVGGTFAVLATFVAGVSSWLLIFSRIGHQIILVPLLTTSMLFFALRVMRYGKKRDVVACAVAASLGLYTYAASFVLPPIMFVTLVCLMWLQQGIRRRHLLIFVATTLLCAIPFVFSVAADPANFFSGYIGGKLESTGSSPLVFVDNVVRGLLALHVRGDVVFRSNPTFKPHLDPISGLLFLVGLIFWLQPERRRVSPLLLLPLVLLQLPSMLVLSKPIEIPSASRTLGIAPIAYLLVASGLWWLAQRWRSNLGRGLVLLLCVALLLLNGNSYFRLYADGLPDHNVPFGRIIATYIDTLPADTEVLMLGCCWGEWSQPEPKGVRYALKQPRTLRVLDPTRLSCEYLSRAPRPTVLIWHPFRAVPAPRFASCAHWLRPRLHRVEPGGPRVFYSSPILPPSPPDHGPGDQSPGAS